MKKLFLPLALLSLAAVYAQDNSGAAQAPSPEQIAAQQAMLNAAGDQIASSLLQDPSLAAWYNDASDEDVEAFDKLCVQCALLNITVYGQFAQNYNQFFNALSNLTGRTNWSAQVTFISPELAQTLQAQAQTAANAQVAQADDSDDAE
ncbi:MAG: hypothetical protein K2X90_04150 [Candidatus Babeliaceae bacterium]|nr:hypothetical protein [Candidatus Babeliaceae bacterium]